MGARGGHDRKLDVWADRRRLVANRGRGAGAAGGKPGDDHDLAMLEAKLAALPARSKAQRKLLARIEARRAKLQKTALKLARRMYRRKAAAFVDRVLAG